MKKYLFTPGPTMVPAEVLLAEATPMIHHRTAQFSAIMVEVVDGMKKLFGTAQDVYLVMGSGSAAMEAAVCNVCSPGDTAICVNGGKFGERWVKLAKAFGCKVVEMKVEWGTAPTLDQIKAALDENPDARALYVTHSETSTGAYTDVEAIAAITRESKTLLGVDAITSVGVHPYKMDEWGVDITVTGSQKGCMIAPGLSYIAVSPRTWDAVAACKTPRFYLDLTALKKNWEKQTTPFTPAVSLIQAQRKALEMIFAEGLENVHARHARLAQAARAACNALGLKLLSEGCPVNGITAAFTPEGVDGDKLVKHVRDKYGVQMTGGQDSLKGKIVRIGHMGYVSETDMLVAIAALEKGLRDMGYQFDNGAGLGAAHKVLA